MVQRGRAPPRLVFSRLAALRAGGGPGFPDFAALAKQIAAGEV